MGGSERFLSSVWYRVAMLKPRLRAHLVVRMHRYRRRLWYVIVDGMGNRVHRLAPASYMIVASMDGTRTLDSLWSDAVASLGEQAPTQDQVIQLLAQLHSNDLIAGDVLPAEHEFFDRQDRRGRSKLLQWILNPLAIRIPLVDPNQFLTNTLGVVRPLLGPAGAVLWLATVLPALLLALRHWPELTEGLSDRVLSAGNLVLLAAIFPFVKLLHELGHGYVTKAHGGEVHELGVMTLVLLPLPYVDVSAAAGFRSKWTRCLVGCAGVIVELFIAALAMYVWLLVEPGMVRAVAFNVMVTAGVSSLLFNGNPLLRYDAYYVLADAIEVPNLGPRGGRYWVHLIRRYLCGDRHAEDFPATPGERVWFLLYSPVAAVYRIAITIGISLFLVEKYLAVGIALALWSLAAGIVWPVLRGMQAIAFGPGYRGLRLRAVSVCGGLIAVGVAILLLLPLPLHTDAEGVVWLPDDAVVRAGADGFVRAVVTPSSTAVARGQVLVATEDPELMAQVDRLRAREAELASRLESVRFTDRVTAVVTATELAAARTERQRAEDRLALLEARAMVDGTFVMPLAADAPGRFFRRGEILGYVLPSEGARRVRATVTQENIELVRHHMQSARIRLADSTDRLIGVREMREVPAGRDQLPSAALGTTGGGAMAVDPRDEHGTTAMNRVFQLDLEFDSPVTQANFGGRAYVRFEHDWEPLDAQLWRRMRQLLLARVAM